MEGGNVGARTQVRTGIACAGNWIVDRVKLIDRLPRTGMLGNIISEAPGTGGSSFNVLADLARLGAGFPLVGVGMIGKDIAGDYVRKICRDLRIDSRAVQRTDKAATSYTDVMTDAGTGERTFYHCRGANALFGPEHVPVVRLKCRIFHLGYLLLLDRMDGPDRKFGTVAARLLESVRAAGIKTSVDVVSEESDRFCRIVPASLRHTDYLILNEIEAGRTTGIKVRKSSGRLDVRALERSIDALHELGDMEMVCVHMPEGACVRFRDGRRLARGALDLPKGYIAGTVGAGDAFCAGMLYGLHEGWDAGECLKLGACAAAACLRHPSATEGVGALRAVLKLSEKYPEKPAPLA